MSGVLYSATMAAALGCGLMAGVFFAFSAFVMDGLAKLASAPGMSAMQSINRAASSPLILTALFGTALVCTGLSVWALANAGESAVGWHVSGSGLYLVGAIVVTIARNVPMNEALARVDPERPEAAAHWNNYLLRWTAWNHVRGFAALGAAALLTVALVQA